MAALMKGRWETALRFHALTPLALVILGVWAAAPLLGRRVALPWRGITAAFAIYGIARMGAVLFW